MTQSSGPYAPRTTDPSAEPSTTDVVRDEAAGVGQHAREAGSQVAQTAGDQARQVAAETGRQARDLLGEAQGQAADQAAVQQQRAAQQLRSVADEVGQMAANGGQSGVATEFARQAADRMHGAASWLEQREPADLLNEVRNFARRRPATFLIGAAVAGLAAGRLTRGLKDRGSDSGEPYNGQPGSGRGTVPGIPAATTVDPAGSTYPAETDPAYPAPPAYPTETAPSYAAAPAYPPSPAPADPAAAVYPTEPEIPVEGATRVDTAFYPADSVYQADPQSAAEPGYRSETEYPTEPGATPRYEGPA